MGTPPRKTQDVGLSAASCRVRFVGPFLASGDPAGPWGPRLNPLLEQKPGAGRLGARRTHPPWSSFGAPSRHPGPLLSEVASPLPPVFSDEKGLAGRSPPGPPSGAGRASGRGVCETTARPGRRGPGWTLRPEWPRSRGVIRDVLACTEGTRGTELVPRVSEKCEVGARAQTG